MRITLKNGDKYTTCFMPAKERNINKICNELGIENDIYSKVRVVEVDGDEKLDCLISGNEHILEELNFFMKRLDEMNEYDKKVLYAVVDGLKQTEMEDILNTSYNTICYSLIDDFSDLDKLGKELYRNECGPMPDGTYEETDGVKVVEDIMKNNQPMPTKYGFIYLNGNEIEEYYSTKNQGMLSNDKSPIVLEISTKLDRDYLYMPSEETEIKKALQRLGVSHIRDVGVELRRTKLPEKIENIVKENDWNIEKINQVAKNIEQIDKSNFEYISKMVDNIGIQTIDELNTFLNCYDEFEYFTRIRTAEDYGRYMICESGRFEYDENLEFYIDFEKYGQQKMDHETGAFTKKGYLVYHGFNEEMEKILNEKLGLEIKEPVELEEFRLYMPLNGTTYYDENDYGEYYETDYEMEVNGAELLEYEDEIRNLIGKRNADLDQNRGLMEYFSGSVEVNAKVKSFNYDVEEIGGELLGVAVLQVKGSLDTKNIEEIKEYVTGQSSDGYGEGFEQQEIISNRKGIYVSFWNSEEWYLKTEEEMGFRQNIEMGGMSL